MSFTKLMVVCMIRRELSEHCHILNTCVRVFHMYPKVRFYYLDLYIFLKWGKTMSRCHQWELRISYCVRCIYMQSTT